MAKEKVKRKTDHISLEGILEPADVLLVVPPFTGILMPSVGIHSLQASCRDAGININVLYSNLIYSNLIGSDIHDAISKDFQLFLYERIFAAAAFHLASVSIGRVMPKFSDPAWTPDHLWNSKEHSPDSPGPKPVVHYRDLLGTVDLEHLESLTGKWLQNLAREIGNVGFRIVGSSTTYGGLLPSVALLNGVKKSNPNVITILGGIMCEGEMAEGILSLDAGIDYIHSGEGEITFPAFVRQVLEDRLPKERIIYGESVTDLDTIPLPDYQDFLFQKRKVYPQWSSVKDKYEVGYEASRGCSFGRCTFCALNGKKNIPRCKSPGKIIQDLKMLVKQHGTNFIVMTDNMMPYQYFDTLIPRLSTEIPGLNTQYAVKSDLTLDKVLALKKAGVHRLLLGIESLSSSVLKRMQKGVSAGENISILRYARSLNIDVHYNILFGVPGDKTSEYEEMLKLLPLIRHIHPPHTIYPIVLERFSKYHRSPEKFGIIDLRPAEFYRDILPSHSHPDKIAYFFTADVPSQSRKNASIINALWREFQVWVNAWAIYQTMPLEILLPTLHITRKSNGLFVLEDTRGLPGQPKQMEISEEQANRLLVSRPREDAEDMGWALEAGLGVIMDSWFIPLATAEPALIQEFEHDYEHSRPDYTPGNEKNKTGLPGSTAFKI
ncbi:MAG: RiPP maturation radical SAM C-methyltransferase [Candidatus Aminicenantes bacterium]|jgi:ribosomal peptide maturation radical SAM protein 1